MILRLLIALLSFTPCFAAVSSQNTPAPQSPVQQYLTAINALDSKKSCDSLSELSKQQGFSLRTIAELRFNEACGKKVDWQKFFTKVDRPFLKEMVVQSWFKDLIEKKNYKEAWFLYRKYPKTIELENREFDELATNALKTKLSKTEKANLRDELYRRSPRFIPRPKKSEYLKVAMDFRSDRQFEKALQYYRKVINDPKMTYHQRWYGFKGARLTYKLERWSRMEKYILASKQWANFLNGKYKWSKELTRMHHDANIEYVRTLWTERGQTEAKKVLLKLEKQLKKRHSLQTVYWLKGKMAEERGKYKETVLWLNKAAKETTLSDRDEERVLWALAWNQRRIGQFQDSQNTLERLKKSPQLTFFGKTKYLYWQAENLMSLKKADESRKAFLDLAELDLFGFYGALAYRRLNRSFPKPPKQTVEKKDLLAFFDSKDREFFSDLVEAEEYQISEALVFEKVKKESSWGEDEWIDYLHLLQLAGAYRASFIQYHRLSNRLQVKILEEHPHILFPQPFYGEVQRSAKLTKVSPSLIYSIMKQESGFDIKARSHADAFGLLQLIPQVAKIAAKRLPSVEYDSPYDLFKPQVIIPLGAENLNRLFTKFDSNFILSVASYNASEKAVKGWVKSRFQGDPVTFIEDIPYEETKGYVKLVMRNYIAYNRFESNEDKFLFPEVCLAPPKN